VFRRKPDHLCSVRPSFDDGRSDYERHEPDYSGTTTAEWDAPRESDFETDDLSEIADHFVLSASGFPPVAFSDLKLPVVDPDGNLNENAL
jgi:hypothetical protein